MKLLCMCMDIYRISVCEMGTNVSGWERLVKQIVASLPDCQTAKCSQSSCIRPKYSFMFMSLWAQCTVIEFAVCCLSRQVHVVQSAVK